MGTVSANKPFLPTGAVVMATRQLTHAHELYDVIPTKPLVLAFILISSPQSRD